MREFLFTKRMCSVLFAIILPFIINAQNSDSLFIKRIADEMLVNGEAFENLRHLTKHIGGRLAGSPQMVKAENWGLITLKQSGADTAYLQQCMVPHWVRGGTDKASVVSVDGKMQKKILDVLALGNSLGTGKKGIKAEVVAVSSFDDLEKHKSELKGKIVFYNYPFNPTYIVPALAYRESGIYRANGASRAAKYGAIGVIVRSMSEGTNNHPHTGSLRYNDSFPKIPAVAVGLQDADFLWQICQQHSKVQVAFTTNGYFLPDTVGHNVIAELKGSDGSNDFITVGGHLDSWDINEGAHDDGTGVVQTIEVLRTVKTLGYRPRKTIRFVLFANEENGARGGLMYAEQAKAKNENHLLAIESDEGGFTPRGFSFTISDEKLEKIKPWTKLLNAYGVYELTKGGGGTDIAPLNKTINAPLAGLVPDNQRYFDLHHARNDVFEAVNKRELLLGAINMAALIYLVDKYGLQ
ncbi:MAG TPA: M20/M25/M40 family metallo-hydrolase [Segetibacter sp.]|nr:M20/M25/M40 family metallo-hydrolase [Segetibacter sp.]